jgi:hypothetical protein
MIWFHPASSFNTTTASNGCAAIKSQSGQNQTPLLPLLCICIHQILWTFFYFFLKALHGIVSTVPSDILERKPSAKRRRQSRADTLFRDLLLLEKKSAVLARKRHGIVRDRNFDQRLSRTLATHVKLAIKIEHAIKRFFLLTTWPGFSAPILILVVPRSAFVNLLPPDVFAYIAFEEGGQAQSCSSDPLPICVPWASPSLRQDIIAKVLDNFQCSPNSDPPHDYKKCYTPAARVPRLNENENEIIKIAYLSTPVRSKAGSTQDRPNPSTTQPRSSTKSRPAVVVGKKKLVHNKNHKSEETSEEEEEKRNSKKRKRSTKADDKTPRLPCIYHVFDRGTYTKDHWKFCNPQTKGYTDPSELS